MEQFRFDEHSSLSKVLETQGSSFRGLAAVPVALDRLHRLATAIRRSSLESRKEKLLTKIWDSDHDTYLGECIYQFVQGRFPSARASLLKQLTAAICSQRRKLIYLPKHNKKLEVQKPTYQHIPLHEPFHLPLPPRNHQYGQPSEQPMSITDASIPNSIQLRRLLGRAIKPPVSVASTGSAIQGESLSYPEAPVFAAGAALHPCPYCSEPLPTSKLDMKIRSNVDYWRLEIFIPCPEIWLTLSRNHVNQDLEPYFCLSEECKEPLKFFTHYSDWFDHMSTSHTDEWFRSAHMLTWYCDLGHTKRELFADRESFESHTKDSHPNLTTSQLRARAKKSKTVALREPLVCPLCECAPSKLSVISSQHHNSKEYRATLCKHIGFHLKALSLMSFRLVLSEKNNDQMDNTVTEEPSTEMSIKRMVRSIQDESVDTEERLRWSRTSDSSLSENADAETSEHDLEVTNVNSGVVDWSQLPGFSHLSKSQTTTSLSDPDMEAFLPRQAIRSALKMHADDFITGSMQLGEGVAHLTLPEFLHSILPYVRKQFLIGDEPGYLVLGDMKWIHDNCVKPLQDQNLLPSARYTPQTPVFYCTSCDRPLRRHFLIFDEVLEHFVETHGENPFSDNEVLLLDDIAWEAELPFHASFIPDLYAQREHILPTATDPTDGIFGNLSLGDNHHTPENTSWGDRARLAPNPDRFFDPGEEDLTSSFWADND